VVDRAGHIGSSWRGRYDRLRLNTWRPLSHLPGRRFPKGTPTFPTRDQVIDHLERHGREEGIELRLGTSVHRIDANGGWSLRTDAGEIRAPEVIVATGYEGSPLVPDWEGRDEFGGRLLHSSEYRNPEPFRGMKVLVVGPGCSGMEIAHDLATGGAGTVWLSVRTPPNLMLRQGPGPVPGDLIGVVLLRFPTRFADGFARIGQRMDFGDLSEFGLPTPDEGVFARLERLGVAPSIVDKEVIDAIKEGKIEIVRGVEALGRDEVRLADGATVEPDAIVCATGYRCGLEPLVGHLNVLDERGRPRAVAPEAPAPGLRFVGYVPRPGGLGYMGKEARRAAKAIARELR
jgi:glycine/D-amino acid oxidase-like deaminating enzyme